ncbi:MAG: DNA polymerase III subunit gamma and tau, partial [Streptosporangiaceae bacterium]
YTDEGLLDEVTGAFAAGDGAAIFRAVDRVVEGGHDPRRFAADLLDRMRDLLVLSAVPDAGETGLLDMPADRLERMREQSARFGQAQLTRAAEVINAGLVEMRGATSPRLLLELMCAQVLLPGAAAGERAMLARLEALERRLATGGEAGATSQRAAAAASPAMTASPAPRVSPAAGQAATGGSRASAADPRRSESPAAIATRPGSTGRAESAAPSAANPSRATNAAPAGSGPRAGSGPPAGSSPPAASGPPARDSSPAGDAGRPPSPGLTDADSVREHWAEILEAVKDERKVAWIVLGNATVHSLTDGVLTLNFTSEGYAKGFFSSGYDGDLGRVLKAMFGVAPQIKTVAGAPAGAAAGAGRPDRGGQPGRSAPPGRRAPAGRRPAGQQDSPARRNDLDADPGHAADAGHVADPGGYAADPGPYDADPGPYDTAAAGQQDGRDTLTGMDLIERELGGKVIDDSGDG